MEPQHHDTEASDSLTPTHALQSKLHKHTSVRGDEPKNLTGVIGKLHRVDGVHLKAQNLTGEKQFWKDSISQQVMQINLQKDHWALNTIVIFPYF